MDAVLHAERIDGRRKRLHTLPAPVGDLPDGAMLAIEDTAFLVIDGQKLRWTADGYRPDQRPQDAARLITPPSTLRTLAAGYRPALHPSAFATPIG